MNSDDLKRFALLVELGDEEREALAEVLEERVLPDGRSLFREGSEGDGLVFLVSGQLALKSRRSGSLVGTLDPGMHLGAASLFSLGKREISAIADGPSTVWVLPRSGLPRLVEDAPRAAFRLAEAIAGELAGLLRQRLEELVDHELG